MRWAINIKQIGIIALLFLGACNNQRNNISKTGSFGEKFSESNAISIDSAIAINNFGLNQIVYGNIVSYCKGEGCWLTLSTKNNKTVFVNIKDKAFTLPVDIDGKEVIISGLLTQPNHQKYTYKIDAIGLTIK